MLVAELPSGAGSSGGGLFDAVDRLVGIHVQRWSPWTGHAEYSSFVDALRVRDLVTTYCARDGSPDCTALHCADEFVLPGTPPRSLGKTMPRSGLPLP